MTGKLRRKRRADSGRTSHWKKAIVRLKEGEIARPDLSAREPLLTQT